MNKRSAIGNGGERRVTAREKQSIFEKLPFEGYFCPLNNVCERFTTVYAVNGVVKIAVLG